ncbi:nucleotidyltransferase family protein [Alteromonas pelagimontana]|uniref:Nucleotidyltransferase family protein n=2 Tax=Alteromonas pelagimontana TaxID=1858656 RepID=A0A6M4MI89_9ALTE|nr:nucleotidyltransferase family protein [Alteromonas pelagimontana]
MNVEEQRTAALLNADNFRQQCLQAVRSLRLPGGYISAGFLRNAIWDHLHGKLHMTPLNDIDVVYFDSTDTSFAAEQRAESILEEQLPNVKWQVRNQARMHLVHGHSPYRSTAEAVAHWLEVPRCVGVRINFDDKLTFLAPFGLHENWSLTVKINPLNPHPEAFISRIQNKRWREIWPQLMIQQP